jgi:hypothetical protein
MAATSTNINPGSCTQVGQDCSSSRCCTDASLTCYEKNQWWATCLASCSTGIDFSEAPEYQTPWSCVILEKSTRRLRAR